VHKCTRSSFFVASFSTQWKLGHGPQVVVVVVVVAAFAVAVAFVVVFDYWAWQLSNLFIVSIDVIVIVNVVGGGVVVSGTVVGLPSSASSSFSWHPL
jgi:hypothetical protein